MKHYLFFLTIIVLSSCSGKETRLKLLENELKIKLPETFETIENKTEGAVDFEINITLKFERDGINEIINQINKDSITFKGWTKNSQEYRFDNQNKNEPVESRIDSTEKTLKFRLIHL